MALCAQVVDLVRPNVVEQRGEGTAVGKVGVMQEEAAPGLVRVLIDVVEPVGVEAGGAALEAVDFVAFGKQKLGQIRSVLASAAGNESSPHSSSFLCALVANPPG